MATKKILIIDDSTLLHKMYRLCLKAYEPYDIVSLFSEDGRQGLAQLAENPDADAIILDINMPEMTGLEVLETVRADATFRGVPVVLASTEDDQENVQRGLALGASRYLVKPFTIKMLHEALDEVLSAARVS